MRPTTALLIALASTAFWLPLLPTTVQTGDTGELVAAARNLNVAHPPGYPLWVWLEHVFLELLPWGAVFWKAALLNLLFSAGALASLVWLGTSGLRARAGARAWWRQVVTTGALALSLALSRTYWRYSLLPDVFALHALFTALLCALYLGERTPRRLAALASLFFLSAANHHTTVFLLPLLVDAAWSERRDRRALSALALGALAGMAAGAGLYLSLRLMQPRSLYSWGELTSLEALARHVLRFDYGTFSLSAHPGPSAAGEIALHLARQLFADLSGVTVLAALALAAALRAPFDKDNRRLLLVGACLAAYLAVFVPRMNLAPTGFQAELVSRFFIMPFVLLAVLAIRGRARAKRALPALAIATLAVLALLNARHWRENDFSSNTIVEDYAINFLRMAESERDSIVIVETDERYNALRYAQSVLGQGLGPLVLSTGNAFAPAVLAKAGQARPALSLAAVQPNRPDRMHDFMSELVAPNLARYPFFFARSAGRPDLLVTYYGLGRKLSPGRGRRFESASLAALSFRSDTSLLPDDGAYDIFKDLFADYALYHLSLGVFEHTQGNPQAAVASFERALELVPYCLPALENLCRIESERHGDTAACYARHKRLSAHEYDYFRP